MYILQFGGSDAFQTGIMIQFIQEFCCYILQYNNSDDLLYADKYSYTQVRALVIFCLYLT